MPPKVDPNELKILILKSRGGEPGAASSLAPRLGPLGLNAKKVGEDIQKETAKWKNIKVMLEMKVQNRQATISIIPSSSALLIKELNEPDRDRKKVKNIKHSGNLSMDQIIKVAKTMEPRSISKEFKGTVKQMLGTCVSLGCTVAKENPKDVIKKIDEVIIEV
jgi:large subunit ribosomal protein L12e